MQRSSIYTKNGDEWIGMPGGGVQKFNKNFFYDILDFTDLSPSSLVSIVTFSVLLRLIAMPLMFSVFEKNLWLWLLVSQLEKTSVRCNIPNTNTFCIHIFQLKMCS